MIKPEQQLGILSSKDKNFALPGDIGLVSDGNLVSLRTPAPSSSSRLPDILSRPTVKETQVHALYNANDFIRYTDGSHQDVFNNPEIIEEFPRRPQADDVDLEVNTAPPLLRKELAPMFNNQDLTQGPLSVITLSFFTDHDMSMWSDEVEQEREKMTEMMRSVTGRTSSTPAASRPASPPTPTPTTCSLKTLNTTNNSDSNSVVVITCLSIDNLMLLSAINVHYSIADHDNSQIEQEQRSSGS